MSIKRNFLYNSILTVSGYVFTFATYPYVSRVLGLTNVGIVNFVDGIINYFILFAMMGISTVGIREVATNKTNKAKLSKTFSSIILLNAISTLIAIAILLTAMYTIPQLYPHRQLLYIGICKLVFNSLLVEWFYTGLENFSYITKRTIIIKSVYVASVFLFIHDSSDYQTYYILCVLTVLINGLVNIIYSRKFASLTFNGVSVKPYLSAFFTVGFYIIVTSMYTSFNVAWLGLTAGTDEVGYYTTATKLHTIILALLLAFQNVMFPRVNSLLAEGKHEEYRQKLQLAVDSLLTFAMPIVITSVIFGPNILHFLVGDGFEGSYLPFRIMMPLILVIGYSQITCIQILLAMKQDRRLLFNACAGAAVGLLLNLLIVKSMGAIGSSLVWLTSELVVAAGAQYWASRIAGFRFPWQLLLKYLVTYLPAGITMVFICHSFHYADIVMIGFAAVFVFAYSVIAQLYILKNPVCIQFAKKITPYAEQKSHL